MRTPADTEYAPHFATYVSLVPEADPLAVLEKQPTELRAMASVVAAGRETFRYAPGKWSIREVLGHIIDTERVFGYRAFCISRGEQKPLPRFDQDGYLAASDANARALADLVDEFSVVREANLLALRRRKDSDWDRTGTVGDHPMSSRALLFIMAGHVRHHLRILQEQYGVSPRT